MSRKARMWRELFHAEDDFIAIGEAPGRLVAIKHLADDQVEHDAPHGAAEADEARDCADDVAREQIRRQSHHERGPRLLAEEGDAEKEDDPRDGDVRHEHHARHERGAEPRAILRRH